MNARALIAAAALVGAALVGAPAERARAACDSASILGPVKTALQAATDLHVVSDADSEKQYQFALAARAGLDASPKRMELECGSGGLDSMTVRETNTVYRAWNDALSAGRALDLARHNPPCAGGLRTVASASVTNGWALLNRLFRERPHPDSYATAHRLLLTRARELGFALPPLGDGIALAKLQHKNHWDAFGAGASLAPLCTRY